MTLSKQAENEQLFGSNWTYNPVLTPGSKYKAAG